MTPSSATAMVATPVSFPQPFARDVVAGLSRTRKKIPFQYFYDDVGAELFTRITLEPEYYVTRTETEILRAQADGIATAIGSGVGVCELGSGDGQKTRVLLDHAIDPAWYVPIDIAEEQLRATSATLAARFPDLHIQPLTADFTFPFELPGGLPQARRRVLFSPGLTLWNLSIEQRGKLLRRIRGVVGADGGMLVGVDWVKDAARLEAAYDDSSSATARFNLNVLQRINRELNGTFRPGDFLHRARWDALEQRVEVALVAQRDVTVRAAGHQFAFTAGEAIVTEYSYKFTRESLAAALAEVGWQVQRSWSDPNDWMSVVLLSPLGPR